MTPPQAAHAWLPKGWKSEARKAAVALLYCLSIADVAKGHRCALFYLETRFWVVIA